MDIVEFLRARLDEDEHRTRQAWAMSNRPDEAPRLRRAEREVEAKRRIVEACRPDPAMPVDSGRFVAAMVLCTLAAVYADHPDYDPDWTV